MVIHQLEVEMSLKIAVLCLCFQLFAFVETGDTLRANDGNCIGESHKCEMPVATAGPDVEEFSGIREDKIARTTGLEEIHENQQEKVLGSLWPQLPLLPIVYASSPSLPDGPCRKQALRYLHQLKNETLWAAQMYDASTKFPEGIIAGHTRHLGNFDLCYNLKAALPRYDDDDDDEKEIAGRYCLIDIKYEKQGLPPVNPMERLELEFDPHGTVWEAIREKGDSRRLKRYLLQMALCVPDVCTAADIEAALQDPFERAGIKQNMQFNVSVKPIFSQARKDAPEFSVGGKIYCCLLVGLFLFIASSTWYDYSLKGYKKNEDSMANDFVLCFSVRRNLNTIMEITNDHPGLGIIHLMRFYMTNLTLHAHRLLEYYATPVINMSYIEWFKTFKGAALILALPLEIEGFFCIGGLLVSYGTLRQLDKKKFNFLRAMIIRYLRLTPAYAMVVFFNMLVLPHLGSGPYWKWKVGLERDSCANNWWANLLYVNNYVNPEAICMFQTWYLACDYHLYILALLVTHAFWRMPRKLGYPFLILVILGGCAVPFVNTYSHGVDPLYKITVNLRELRDEPYFTGHYMKTHERIPSYFVGVLVGAILYDHGRSPWRLGKVTSRISFFFVVVLSLGSLLTAHKFFDPNLNPGALEAALYAAFAKAAVATSMGATVLLFTAGQGLTFLYNLLTPRWAQPLARMTYCVYLVHSAIQLYAVGVTRTAKQYGFEKTFWDVIPDTVYAFLLALVLVLAVEGPFRRIEKRFMTKTEQKSEEPPKKVK